MNKVVRNKIGSFKCSLISSIKLIEKLIIGIVQVIILTNVIGVRWYWTGL